MGLYDTTRKCPATDTCGNTYLYGFSESGKRITRRLLDFPYASYQTQNEDGEWEKCSWCGEHGHEQDACNCEEDDPEWEKREATPEEEADALECLAAARGVAETTTDDNWHDDPYAPEECGECGEPPYNCECEDEEENDNDTND